MNVTEVNPLVRVLAAGALFLTISISLLAGDAVTVRPKEIDDVLVNPGVGFMTFQRFNGDSLDAGLKWTEGFPIDYQPFTGTWWNCSCPKGTGATCSRGCSISCASSFASNWTRHLG